ncbi:MSCRAMM family protein [Enterococcus faecalis]|uniref:MSCRAMM family protein n=1 Tax=Enterococcus faecalis TaxID=1351 RepID=UPI003D77661F
MKKILQKIPYVFLALILVMNQLGLLTPVWAETVTPTVAGDDPGVTIHGPSTISSNDQVELEVSLSTSSGKLNEDGKIQVTIPKSIVKNQNDLTNNLVLGAPFYLDTPAIIDDGNGNYILNIAYDHTKVDQDSALGATFVVKFQAPLIYPSDDSIPDIVDFNVDLIKGNDKISSDETSSTINKATSTLPSLDKYSTRPLKEVNGVNAALMSLDNPASNIFAIRVNYNQQTINQAKIVDTTPEGTELTDPGQYIPASGDATPYEHIRIAKVTSRGADGAPDGWVYATSEFEDKIIINTNGFEINFGDITPDDSYVVMYAEKVTDDNNVADFGVRYNHVDLYSGDSIIRDFDTAIALDDSMFNAILLTKKVEQTTLSTTNGVLEYSLTLKSNDGVIAAGTVITDPLPEFTAYLKTTAKEDAVFSDATYESSSNTLSYIVLKDIPEGEEQQIKFQVQYSNTDVVAGERIVNKAAINYAGTNIFSNDATTTLDGSAYLYKVDAENENPLAGAIFKVIDAKGNTIVANLTTDEDGFINSGILPPGEYAFVETKAPEGYVLDETPITFTVIEGQETPINLTAINKLEIPKTGSVTLEKLSKETNQILAGAEFKLVTKDGTVIEENLVTDKNGHIQVTGLAPGDYQFVETKAPEGYVLDETPVTFSILEDDDTEISVTKTNSLITTEPSTTEPSTTEPSTTEPSTTEPSTTEPSTTEPSTTEPSTTEPSTTEPSTTEPSTTEPSTTEPSTTEPSTTEPNTNNTDKSTSDSSQGSKTGSFPKTGEENGGIAMVGLGISILGIAFYLIRKNNLK